MKKILGDNPIFGVNHAGRGEQLYREKNLDNAVAIIQEAAEQNFDAFMVSPHNDLPSLTQKFNNGKIPLPLCIVWPYPHSLNEELVSLGYRKFLSKRIDFGIIYEAIYNISVLFLNKKNKIRLVKTFSSLVKSDLQFYIKTQDVKYIALHNVLYDLLLASGNKDLLIQYIRAVQSLGFKPILLTQNLNRAVEEDFTYGEAILCGSLNPSGFMMDSPYEDIVPNLRKYRTAGNELWAMQIMASGKISIQEVINSQVLEQVDGVVYATTKKERVINFATFAKGFK